MRAPWASGRGLPPPPTPVGPRYCVPYLAPCPAEHEAAVWTGSAYGWEQRLVVGFTCPECPPPELGVAAPC